MSIEPDDVNLRVDAHLRFSGLADVYARSRPDYPAALLDHLEAHCGLGPGAMVVDVGSGTGISSRWLASRGWRVVGIEPNDDMRRQAQEESGGIDYRLGAAEATGLPDACADLVASAQAFHWFDPGRALAEFARILKRRTERDAPAGNAGGGWAALIWNERDPRDPFTAEFGRIIRESQESARTEDARRRAGAAFMASDLFRAKELAAFRHEQGLDEEGVVGRALSMSHVTREPVGQARLIDSLRACFRRWASRGAVLMKYETSLYVGQVC